MASRAEKLLAKGRSLEAKGRRDKALEVYRDACRAEPYDPDLWSARAEAAKSVGLRGEAAEAWFHVGELYARGGLPTDALPVVKRVLELEPGHGGARRLLGVLEKNLNDDSDPPSPAASPVPAATPTATATETATISAPVPAAVSDPPTEEIEPEIVEVVAEPAPPPQAARRAATAPPIPPAAPPPSLRASTQRPAVAPAPAPLPMHEHSGAQPLDEISLAERLSAAGPGDSHEIVLDEEGHIDVVHAVASTLTTSPLLSELDSDLVRHLVDCGKLVHRTAEDHVFRQGDLGNSLYLILAGEVAVVYENRPKGASRELARLRPGAFFGEMALLTNTPRSANVVALKNSDFLEISRKAVRELIDRDPRVLKLLMRFFRARLVGTLLQTSPLFKPFSREERRDLVSRFRLRELGAEHTVITEGGAAEGLFVVLVGRLEVLQSLASSHRKGQSGGDGLSVLLGTLVPGDVFGEMSLLEDAPAMATVRTRTRAWVLLLPRSDFNGVVERHPEIRAQLEELAAARHEKNKAAQDGARELRVEPV